MPFRITTLPYPCRSPEQIAANVADNASVPLVAARPPHDLPLAVVGGGNSVKEHLEELRSWPGHIWAINGTCAWLARQGIKSVLFSVDPELRDYEFELVPTALLSTGCDPYLFMNLKGRAFAFHTHERQPQGLFIPGGSTSAIRAQILALRLGFHDIGYFGCEGSWEFGGTSHSFKDDIMRALIIRAGGKDYVTNLQLQLQSQELANVIRAFPHVFHDRSGGLLAGMIEHPDTWEVVALSTPLRDQLDPDATEPYRKAA